MILDRFEKLKRREKVLLGVAGLCLVGLLVDGLVVGPVVRVLADLDRQIVQEQTELAYCKGVQRLGQAMFFGYDQIQKQYPPSAMSDAEVMDETIVLVDGFSGRAGLRLESTEARDPKFFSYCTEYVVDIPSYSARMEDLLKFLNDLQTAPGLLRVAKLTLVPGDGSTVRGAMRIKRLVLRQGPGFDSLPAAKK